MTTTASKTTSTQDLTALLGEVHAVLGRHGLGAMFRLVVAPEALELELDEVLIQTVDAERRTVELRPRRIGEVGPVLSQQRLPAPRPRPFAST